VYATYYTPPIGGEFRTYATVDTVECPVRAYETRVLSCVRTPRNAAKTGLCERRGRQGCADCAYPLTELWEAKNEPGCTQLVFFLLGPNLGAALGALP
jgi:hypothetical protein